MANNNVKLTNKLFVNLELHFNGAVYTNFVSSYQTKFVLGQDDKGNPIWKFDQIEGNIYRHANGKTMLTGAKWYWGIDRRPTSPNRGHMFRDLGKEGQPFKVVLMAHNAVPFDPWSIASAVHAALTVSSAKKDEPKAEEPTKTLADKAKVDVSADAEEDLAILDDMGEEPLVRLQAGDPTLFVELGIPQAYAERWADWVRENPGEVQNIADVEKIRGIGKVRAEKLISAWHAKYTA